MSTATRIRPQVKTSQANNIVSFPVKPLSTIRGKATNKFGSKKSVATKPRSQHFSRKVNNPKKSPEASLSLIETTDAALEVVMTAKSVAAGLKKGETVLLVSPEKPEHLMRKLAVTGLNVEPFVKKGKLIIFSSQPAIAGNLSLATNYREVFGELFDLAGCPVDRIIVLKMDLLVNLESQYLAYASVSKFTQAADEMG